MVTGVRGTGAVAHTAAVGYVDLAGIGHSLPDGRPLLFDVSLRAGDGTKTALVGANGTGKTTLLRLIAGDLDPQQGAIARSGGLGVMRQFIGSVRDKTTVQDFLVSLAPPALRDGWAALQDAELALMERDDEKIQLAYAHALTHWGDVGGYDAEVLWDTVTVAALGVPYERAKYRELSTLSGGEQKRLALELLLRGPDEVLLLDEPDNYLDVPGKRWLEERLRQTSKTVLFVSHDRELLARVADRIVTIEGGTAWTHGGGFASYHEARTAKHERMAELRRRWEEEHQRLKDLVRTLQQQAKVSEVMAQKYRVRRGGWSASRRRDRRRTSRRTTVRMRLRGGRTGVRAVICAGLELTGLMRPFDAEIFYGERVGVLGANGAGKSHFLRLLGGEPVAHTGAVAPRRSRRARPVRADARPSDLDGPAAARPAVDRRHRPAESGPGSGDLRAAPLRAGRPGRTAVRHAVRRAAGALPDPAARTVRRDAAAARRAHRQSGRGLRRGAGGGAGGRSPAPSSPSRTTAGSPARSTAS